MACELGDVATVEILLSFQPDLTIRAKVRPDGRNCVFAELSLTIYVSCHRAEGQCCTRQPPGDI
jgi:hypothetical protein